MDGMRARAACLAVGFPSDLVAGGRACELSDQTSKHEKETADMCPVIQIWA